MPSNNPQSRNRQDTSERLVNAVGELIAEQGFSNIGVNAVARHAGVDKVLIYRYFKNLDGLYKAYAGSVNFWPSVEEIVGEGQAYAALREQPYSSAIAEVFKRYAQALRNRPLTLEILAWETVERNALTIELERVREAMGLALFSHLHATGAPVADWQAISNIFVGAIHYLLIRGRKIQNFTGMNINDEQEWQRLFAAIEVLCQGLQNHSTITDPNTAP